MNQSRECKIEQFGANLPDALKKVGSALWHPLFFDWVATVFSFGYAAIILAMGGKALHMGIYKGGLTAGFEGYTVAFALTMLVASMVGMAGLAARNRKLRMRSSYVLALSYAWVSLYYFNAIPLPWQAMFVYGFHGVMEAAVYLRTSNDPHHLWGEARG